MPIFLRGTVSAVFADPADSAGFSGFADRTETILPAAGAIYGEWDSLVKLLQKAHGAVLLGSAILLAVLSAVVASDHFPGPDKAKPSALTGKR